MAFLKINNLTVAVKDATPRGKLLRNPTYRGTSGRQHLAEDWVKRAWDFTTKPMLHADAVALRNWVNGLGEHWSFDYDLFSEGLGRAPNAGYSIANAAYTGVDKFTDPTNVYIQVGDGTAGRTISYQIPRGRTKACTASWWTWNNSDSGFGSHRHYVRQRSAAGVETVYLDTLSVSPASLANSSLVLTGTNHVWTMLGRNNANSANTSIWVEDLVIVPYEMTAAQRSAIFTSADAFGLSPRLRVTGDFIDEPGPIHCRAEMGPNPFLGGGDSAGTGWKKNMRQVTFTLHEV